MDQFQLTYSKSELVSRISQKMVVDIPYSLDYSETS
jgi:hypothetical protein